MTDIDMFTQFVKASISGHREAIYSDYCAIDDSDNALDCSDCPATIACDIICDREDLWEVEYTNFITPQIEKYGTDIAALQNDYPEFFI